MARDVGHLGGDGLFAELGVEAAGEFQDGCEHLLVHGFGLHRVGYAVPDDVPAPDGLPEIPDGFGRCLAQIGVHEPRAGRPYVAFGAPFFAQLFGDGDGLGDEFVDISLLDLRTEFGESDVEMRLENGVYLLYPEVGLLGGAGEGCSQQKHEN